MVQLFSGVLYNLVNETWSFLGRSLCLVAGIYKVIKISFSYINIHLSVKAICQDQLVGHGYSEGSHWVAFTIQK